MRRLCLHAQQRDLRLTQGVVGVVIAVEAGDDAGDHRDPQISSHAREQLVDACGVATRPDVVEQDHELVLTETGRAVSPAQRPPQPPDDLTPHLDVGVGHVLTGPAVHRPGDDAHDDHRAVGLAWGVLRGTWCNRPSSPTS